VRLGRPEPEVLRVDRPEATAVVRERVLAARALQGLRGCTNARITVADLEVAAALDNDGQCLLDQAATRLLLSPRGMHRIQRVARTIADLEGEEAISGAHVAEAIGLRLGALA